MCVFAVLAMVENRKESDIDAKKSKHSDAVLHTAKLNHRKTHFPPLTLNDLLGSSKQLNPNGAPSESAKKCTNEPSFQTKKKQRAALTTDKTPATAMNDLSLEVPTTVIRPFSDF